MFSPSRLSLCTKHNLIISFRCDTQIHNHIRHRGESGRIGRRCKKPVNYPVKIHVIAPLRNVFAGAESVWQPGQYWLRRWRNRKSIAQFHRNACSDAQPRDVCWNSTATLGHPGHSRWTTNGYDEMFTPHFVSPHPRSHTNHQLISTQTLHGWNIRGVRAQRKSFFHPPSDPLFCFVLFLLSTRSFIGHSAKVRWTYGRATPTDLSHRLYYRAHLQQCRTDDLNGADRRKYSEHAESTVDADGRHDTAQP